MTFANLIVLTSWTLAVDQLLLSWNVHTVHTQVTVESLHYDKTKYLAFTLHEKFRFVFYNF